VPETAHIGTVTDTECRVIVVTADSGHIRIDGYQGSHLTVSDANRLMRHLRDAMIEAVNQGLAEAERTEHFAAACLLGNCRYCDYDDACECTCHHQDGCVCPDCAADREPEPGGATSAWEHHYG
jgi:hypothetical protein